MSTALFIVPEREVPGLDVFVNGKALGHCKPRHLERLAKQAGVRPLMGFFSQDPEEAAAFCEDAGAEPPEGGFPAEEWFPAEEGLTTVRGLLTSLRAHPAEVPNSSGLIEDLERFESVLGGLASEGVGWHLAVDF
jgi:hypothetical protein